MSVVRQPAPKHKRDIWPEEREGYSQAPPVAYTPVRLGHPDKAVGIWMRRAEQLGSLISGLGMIWTLYAYLNHPAEIARFGLFPPGPVEFTCFGVLVWLLAKWRRAVRPH